MITITPLLRVKERYVGPSGVYNIQNEWYGYADEFKYTIGLAGLQGFGVGCCPPELLPADMALLPGTEDRFSPNYGNYIHIPSASIQCFIPAHHIDIQSPGNTDAPTFGSAIVISHGQQGNSVLARPFTDAGSALAGIFVDKYQGCNVKADGSGLPNHTNGPGGTPLTGGILASRPLQWPVSPITRDNGGANFNSPFSFCNSTALNSAATTPSDTHGGAWAVVRTRGADFHPMPIWLYTQISYLSLAHAQALLGSNGIPISGAIINAAWMSTAPYAPKGNNNVGSDVQMTSLVFARTDLSGHNGAGWAGRSSRAFTGAARVNALPATEFTTHNGQLCGIVDIASNQLDICPGLTSVTTGMGPDGYRLLPDSIGWGTISSNSNIRSAAGLISIAAAPKIDATNLANGDTYRILSAGNTDFTAVGASNNNVGTIFVANGPGTGTGAAIAIDNGIWYDNVNAFAYLQPTSGGTFHSTASWSTVASRRHMTQIGIPREQGTSTTPNATNIFGNDGLYRNLLVDCIPFAGTTFTGGMGGGVFQRLFTSDSIGATFNRGIRAIRLLSN